jgi:hypothetical protein
MGRLADMVEDSKRRALDGATSSGAMERGARMARRFIRTRTRKGIGRHGNQFAPYARSTAQRKGRFSPVTLEETGQMLRSLSIRTNDDVEFDPSAGPAGGGQFRGRSSGRFVAREDITFGASVNLKGSRNRRIGRYHIEGTKHMPQRDWFGVTSNEQTRITNAVGNRVTGGIRRELPEDRRRRVEIQLF